MGKKTSDMKDKMKKTTDYTLSELKTIGRELLSSRSHINNLPVLLTFVNSCSPPQHILESILSLQSFFTPVLSDLPPPSSSKHSMVNDSKDDPEFIYRTWLRSKFDEFVKLLIDVLFSFRTEETLKEFVLDTVMEFVKTGKGQSFHSAIYYRLLHSIVRSSMPVHFLVDLLSSKYFKYIDVRYFTYISLEKLARTLDEKSISDGNMMGTGEPTSSSSSRWELTLHNMHYAISHISAVEGSEGMSNIEMWSESGFALEESDQKELSRNLLNDNNHLKTGNNGGNVLPAENMSKKIKKKFTKAWISYLRLPLPIEIYKEVLVNLHQTVIPHLSNPIVLSDFLTRSYDIGSVVSVMALSSLYVLMTQYGLEYPNFYEKLYALLVPSVFMAKHRAKFFELLDSCLKSPLLPAYLAAAFAKKLSRLSLLLPPSGSLVIIALVHNLLRRHPSINFLVHVEDGDDKPINDDPEMKKVSAENMDISSTSKMSSNKAGIDQFKNEETNLLKSNAMRSSLWEIDTLRHHYCPPVSRFVLSLEHDLTVRAKTTEIAVKDFGCGSYATIFGDEIRRRVKQVPLSFYKATPTSLFSDCDFAGWTFKHVGDNMSDERNKIEPDHSSRDDHTTTKRRRTEST